MRWGLEVLGGGEGFFFFFFCVACFFVGKTPSKEALFVSLTLKPSRISFGGIGSGRVRCLVVSLVALLTLLTLLVLLALLASPYLLALLESLPLFS